MALIGGNGGILLACANSNTYASNGGHNGSAGGKGVVILRYRFQLS